MDPRKLVLNLESEYSESTVDAGMVKPILLAGLKWRSDYWTGLAIDWIDQGAPISETVAQELELVSEDKSLAQKIRHSAFGRAVRWRRTTQQAEQGDAEEAV